MKYYKITPSFKGIILRGAELINDFINTGGINNSNALGNYIQGEKIPIDPIIPIHIINSGAVLNDFQTTGGPLGNRFLISEKLKRKFSDFREELFQFFPAPIIQDENKFEGYWVTHLLRYDTDQIDFKKTQFIFQKSRKKSKPFYPPEFESSEEIKVFENWESFQAFSKNELTHLDSLTAIKPKIKISNPYPIFSFRRVGINELIICEDLKKVFEDEGFSGMEFWPLELTAEEWFGPNGLRKQFYS